MDSSISATVPTPLREEIEQRAEQEFDGNTSEAVRQLLRLGLEYRELEQEIERLEKQNQLILEQRQENQELAQYVEEEQSYREAPIWRRAKWWALGKDD